MKELWNSLYGKVSGTPAEADDLLNEVVIGEHLAKISQDLTEDEKKKFISSDFTPKAVKFASSLPFVRDLVAGYYCMSDGQTPAQIKAAILIPLVYFVMPADAIPDIIPAAGFSDDLGVWLAALKLFGSHVNETHYSSADALLNTGERIEGEQ